MMDNKIVEIIDLSTGYKTSRGWCTVSPSLRLEAYAGELVMLMGPNGSGKSTLMQTIAGLIPARSGELRISGVSMQQVKYKERAKLMSLVLTESLAQGTLSVWDVVTTGRYPYLGMRGRLRAEDIEIMERCMRICRVESMADRCLSTLSDGERQRVMIARALVQDTPLVILDEPTAHLDLPSRLEVLSMLRDLSRTLGKCILVSTHELDLALSWADTIWLFDREHRVESAAPEDLVLSGRIERVFGSEQLHFDEVRGEFRLITEQSQALRLSAEGLLRSWALRALERMGYSVVETSDTELPSVLAEPNGWRLDCMGVEHLCSDFVALHRALRRYYPLRAVSS